MSNALDRVPSKLPKTSNTHQRYWLRRLSAAAIFLCMIILASCAGDSDSDSAEQQASETAEEPAANLELTQQRVEAACGECQFGMEGNGCNLAIRHQGVAYFVDGTSIDDHGDAHADDGFCNAIRHAVVDGHVEDGRFVATSLELETK